MLLIYQTFPKIIAIVFTEMEVLQGAVLFSNVVLHAPALTVFKVWYIYSVPFSTFLLICVQPFLLNFQTGLFHLCLYLEHHGPYTEHIMDILYVQPDNPLEIRADHGRQIHEEILQTLALRNPPFFFGLIFEREDILRPTFILLGRQTVLHPVRVRCHVLSPDKDTNYPNYSTCCVPTNICYLHPNQCQCGGLHSQLVDYENIMLILTEFTGTGKLVSTMEVDVQNSTNISSVYSLKETYAEQIELYKRRRREMHGEYVF